MRFHTFAKGFLGLACVMTAITLPAFGSACLNPCTGSSSTGQDTTDRSNFHSDNSTLTFSNITFDNATGTYDPTTAGLDSATAPLAQLYGVSFIGCLSPQSPCSSNSNGGLVVGTLSNIWNGSTWVGWDGGTDPALTTASSGGGGTWATISMALPANVMAIGFDILLGNNISSSSTTPFGVILSNGSDLNLSTSTAVDLPGSVFFGYSSASAITSLTVFTQNSSAVLGVDNVEIGTLGTGGSGGPGGGSTAAPEVSTMLMVASGFFVLRFGRRWVRL